jgi:hypothetical protein
VQAIAGGAPRWAEAFSETTPKLCALWVAFAGAELLATRRLSARDALRCRVSEHPMVWPEVFDGEAIVPDQLPATGEQDQCGDGCPEAHELVTNQSRCRVRVVVEKPVRCWLGSTWKVGWLARLRDVQGAYQQLARAP